MELIRTGSISESLVSTIRDVGQAVMFTTMVLGLFLLSFSDYLGMAKMGFRSAAIFVALLCDLFLIPAMIIIFKPTFGVKDADTRIHLGENGMTLSDCSDLTHREYFRRAGVCPESFRTGNHGAGGGEPARDFRLSVQSHAAVHLPVRHQGQPYYLR